MKCNYRAVLQYEGTRYQGWQKQISTENTIQGKLEALLTKMVGEVVEVNWAVKLMTELRRRGTRWNVFGITTHEKFELDGGHTHFLEGRMDASFGTTPLAMQQAISLMERNLVNPEKIISHRFSLSDIEQAIEIMGTPERNKVIINP